MNKVETWQEQRAAGWQCIQHGGYLQPHDVINMARDIWEGVEGNAFHERHRAVIDRTGDLFVRLRYLYGMYKDGNILPPFLTQ